MKSYDIAVIGGDGTGPEVTREAVKVLDAAASKYALKLNYTYFDFGGDRYLRTHEVLPDTAVNDAAFVTVTLVVPVLMGVNIDELAGPGCMVPILSVRLQVTLC